jgi:hypothetical protein
MSLNESVLYHYVLHVMSSICSVKQADMLLDGSYQSDMEKVFSTFRIVRKSMIRRGRITVRNCLIHLLFELLHLLAMTNSMIYRAGGCKGSPEYSCRCHLTDIRIEVSRAASCRKISYGSSTLTVWTLFNSLDGFYLLGSF